MEEWMSKKRSEWMGEWIKGKTFCQMTALYLGTESG